MCECECSSDEAPGNTETWISLGLVGSSWESKQKISHKDERDIETQTEEDNGEKSI